MRILAVAMAAAALALGACARTPPDPWAAAAHGRSPLSKELLHDAAALGRVDALVPDADGLWVVGEHGALRLDAAGAPGPPRRFPQAVSGLEGARVGGRLAGFAGRTDEGAVVLDARGRRLLRLPAGARDAAAGDLDGDGALDVVVGLHKRAGVVRLGADGRTRWQRPDSDVWQVALADTDGDGRPEIVHTNRTGAFVVRAPDGEVIERFETGFPTRYFAAVAWPRAGGPARLLQREEDRVVLFSGRGHPVASLSAPVWNADGRVAAAAFDLDGSGRPWLAVLDRLHAAGPSVLSVFDDRGRRVHDEVILDGCDALAARPRPGGARELALGCADGRVWRYGRPRGGRPGPVQRVAQLTASGDALGPLSFGDSPGRVRALRTLLPGHRCRFQSCEASYVRLGGRDWVLATEFRAGGLARVALLGLPEPEDAYDRETRSAWRTLVGFASARYGRPEPGARDFPPRAAVSGAPSAGPWRVVDTHRFHGRDVQVELGVATVADDGPLQYAAYASFAPSGAAASPGLGPGEVPAGPGAIR